MSAETWRLFIGMALPEQHLALLGQAQRELAGAAKALRPINPATLHLTLHFLGDVAAELAPELARALSERLAAPGGPAAPLLRLDGLGGFPDLRQPRVVWAGLAGEIERLAGVRELAQQAGELAGVGRDPQPFAPHVTLGYARRDARPPERAALGELVRATPLADGGTLPYARVALIRSILASAGARHMPLAAWELAAPQSP